ncbi:MAG: transcriptional regulator [Bdellovibrionaceae bacterium]|nr:transcriptional regulator [Pseudobdellovibrionaceae bacterium]
MSEKVSKLEPSVLYDRSKLLIMTSLATTRGPISFNELLESTQLTKGNLSSHLQKLEGDLLVKINKEFVDRKPLTTVEITAKGKSALKTHLNSLQALIQKIKV